MDVAFGWDVPSNETGFFGTMESGSGARMVNVFVPTFFAETVGVGKAFTVFPFPSENDGRFILGSFGAERARVGATIMIPVMVRPMANPMSVANIASLFIFPVLPSLAHPWYKMQGKDERILWKYSRLDIRHFD